MKRVISAHIPPKPTRLRARLRRGSPGHLLTLNRGFLATENKVDSQQQVRGAHSMPDRLDDIASDSVIIVS